MTTIALINGHPDPDPSHFCAALCETYEQAAREAGHTVRRIEAGALDFGFLTNAQAFETAPPESIAQAQATLVEADHLVLVYPLWLGTMPARLKAFLEHLGREKFFLDTGGDSSGWPAKKMAGKSARVVVTMGMPGLAYRLFFGGHSLKALEKGILGISGFSPVRDTLFGLVESGADRRRRMLDTMARLGSRAA